ncbi:hypothetical protein Esti_002428 [Eimeria stiedai]
MGKRRFPLRCPLRALLLLQWGIVVLSLIVDLVPLSVLATNAIISSEGLEGDVEFAVENDLGGANDQGNGSAPEELQTSSSSDVQSETASAVGGSLAGASKSAWSPLQQKPVLLAIAVGVMLAILGAAAHRARTGPSDPSSRNVGDRIKKLVTLMPDVTRLADLVDTVGASVSLKFFKGALAAADKMHKGAKEPGEAPKKLSKEQLDKEVGLRVVDSISSLRFMVNTACDQADFLTKQASAVPQPSLPPAEMVETERAVLKQELVDAYVIIKACLEKSIKKHARFAEEGSTNLKKLPTLTSEDDGLLLSLARRHMEFVKAEATSCTLANDVMANFTKQLVVAHREFHLDEGMASFVKIGELHAVMKAYKAMALNALQKPTPSDLLKPLKEFVELAEVLEKQFDIVSRSFERLRLSDSTATNVDASANVTAEATKFVEQHQTCTLKLRCVKKFLDGDRVPIKEGASVFREAIKTTYRASKVDHDHMMELMKTMRERKHQMFQGSVAGFKRPLVSAEIIQRVVGEMEDLESAIKEAMQQAQTHASGHVGLSPANDQDKLQNMHDARLKMAILRGQADEHSAFFTMLDSLENTIEHSMHVFATVEAALQSKGKAARSKDLDELLKRFVVISPAWRVAQEEKVVLQAACKAVCDYARQAACDYTRRVEGLRLREGQPSAASTSNLGVLDPLKKASPT